MELKGAVWLRKDVKELARMAVGHIPENMGSTIP
jgi:hypothetical protein